MHIDLTGKSALVTGSTAGIGLAIATGLAQAGADVTVVGRSQDTVDAAVEQVNKAAGSQKATGVVADAGTADGCEAIIQARPDADILVNNLGIYGAQEFFDVDDVTWDEFFQVN